MRKLINGINNSYMLQQITMDVKSKMNFETAQQLNYFPLKSWGKLARKKLKILEFLLE